MNYRILSGSALKMIAVITMGIDHTAWQLLWHWDAFTEPLFMYHHRVVTWYFLLRCVGRLAFPIFAFLIVEGFIHTRNRRRYGWSLFVCALISEIPYALFHNGLQLMGHNVMFTLLWGFLGLCAVERYRHDWRRVGGILVAMLAVAFLFRAEYGGTGFTFIILLYALRRHLALQALLGCCLFSFKWVTGLAFIPIAMYNGQRGFIKGAIGKYLFYAFYPAHLMIIWLIRQHLFG